MRRILTITLCALTLAGCASTYNKSALPTAAAALQHETVACKSRWKAKDIKSYSEWQACQLIAERSFAQAIALTKMDAFDAYAANMKTLAADRDAHRVTDRQVRSRANDIQWRFFADCGCKPENAHFGGYFANSAGQDLAGPSGSFGFSPRGRELSGT